MKNKTSNRIIVFMLTFVLLAVGVSNSFTQEDHTHFSKTFGKEKPYRIFLPKDYQSSQKRYPVIYYFHGNKGSHQSPLSEIMKQLINEKSIILVAWNGRSVDSDIRPYNIGFHSNINYETQFKDYFPELVAHIDSNYRTHKERSHRAVIGHSMGGIMSFFLAGKYPHMVGVAANIKGSPEFFIGYPNNHTLYNVRYFFKNLYGVKLRFHNSTVGELVHLNCEVNQGALHEGIMPYDYRVYEGGHGLEAKEFTDAFLFVMDAFKNPLPKPERWHHTDLYPVFEVWGYDVKSNLAEPGFIELHGVTKGGLGTTTKKWQPKGRPIPGVQINVETAPVYKPNSSYYLLNYNILTDKKDVSKIHSNAEGKISFEVDHNPHQIGIFRKNDPAEIVFLGHKVNGEGVFLDHKKECRLKLHLLNRGGSTGKGLKISLTTTTENVTIANPEISVDDIESCEAKWLVNDFKVTASNEPTTDGSPFRIRFKLTVTDGNKNTWEDEFDAPIYYNVPKFTNIGIDDGDSEIFGNGNGNNIAEPGESIMIYEISHRTRLYYDDPYIDSERIHIDLQPDKWGDGYSISSVIHISEDCPIGHQIRFLASYDVKEWKTIKRNVTWGTFTITIGEDSEVAQSQVKINPGDPTNNTDIPFFFKSRLSDIENELQAVQKGKVKIITTSPGRLPVYEVNYGKKEDFHTQANYNSAVAAQNPAFFAQKNSSTKPVVLFLGPVHGQEVEGIVGMVNLIHIMETGKDYRGKDWNLLKNKLDQCRVIIIPCANPDGRKRCPYDSFLGLPSEIMTKYGQGTRKDGTSWGWPMAKSLHPMMGNVGILGAYFNDDGINMMHDDFFYPMASETKAILDIVRSEVPDMCVSLHSHENPPRILQAAYEPWFMKERIDTLIRQVNHRYRNEGLAFTNEDWLAGPSIEDKKFPPKASFNLISAIHHVSGSMAFTFECPHGVLREGEQEPIVSYEDILDIQLNLYDEMIDYLLKNRLYWE